MQDVPIITDQAILANWPDTVLHDKKENTCLLITTAIPNYSNINTKETEKLYNYTDLEIEVSRMWKVRTKIVPIIIAALGTIKKGLDRNLQLLPGHPSATELQQITLMGTAHIIHKVLGYITLTSCWVLDLSQDRHLITKRHKQIENLK